MQGFTHMTYDATLSRPGDMMKFESVIQMTYSVVSHPNELR